MVSNPFVRGILVSGVVALGLAATPAGAPAQSIFAGDDSSEEVDEATATEQAKTDLALCAPHLADLERGDDPEAFAKGVENEGCRQAIFEAQEAGLSKEQIVDILMGSTDVPDPDGPTVDHDGPPRVE